MAVWTFGGEEEEDSPELPVDYVGRALYLGAAVAGAPGVHYELDVPAPELALRRVRTVLG